MVPQWSRTLKFANPYAFAGVDVLFAILWFCAYIAVSTWNWDGISAGQAKKMKGTGCQQFAYGSTESCDLSRVTVWLGAFIDLLFALTSILSIYTLLRYRKTGALPYGTRSISTPSADPVGIEAQTASAFSSNPHDPSHDAYDDEGLAMPTPGSDGDGYGLLHEHGHELHDEEIGGHQHEGRGMGWGQGQGYAEDEHVDLDGYGAGASYGAGGAYTAEDSTYHGAGANGRGDAGDPFWDDLALSHGSDHRRSSHSPPPLYHGGGGGAGEPVRFPEANYGYRGAAD
ncbi:MAG: hypothetical protein M1827_000437 [Pycnora praestabilis]|nr:MAG: hypothetical protein M1827_000437 [Pycnora praestabilis]